MKKKYANLEECIESLRSHREDIEKDEPARWSLNLMNGLNEKDPWYVDLKDFFVFRIDKIRERWWNFKRGIKNLYRWAPTIWKSHSWDYYVIFEVLDQQLKLMERDFKNSNHMDHTERLEQIKRMRLVIARLLAHDYGMAGCKKWKSVANWHYGSRHLPIGYFLNNWDNETYMKDQDLEYLCKLLKKHIWGLWD